MEDKLNKGMIVVVCAPSQGGKDTMTEQIMHCIKVAGYSCGFPTAYKTRPQRQTDPAYIKSVMSKDEIPVPETSQIGYKIYGNQDVVYDKDEIQQHIDNGEIVFIATGDVGFSKTIKEMYKDDSMLIFIKRQQVSKNTMMEEEIKRAGGKEKADLVKVEESVNKRIDEYQHMRNEYQEFVKDKNLGADYIMKNWFTLFGSEWNSQIGEFMRGEVYSAANLIMDIVNFNNDPENANKSWRGNRRFVLSEEERNTNPLSLQEDYFAYVNERRDREY